MQRSPLRWTSLSCLAIIVILAPAAAFAQGALIIDHRHTDLSQVPAYWIDQAKQLTIHYGHTSHGSQVISGANRLEQLDPFYSIAVRASGTEGLPPVEDPPALRMYDGNPPETYITPEDYWATESGRDRTRAVADTGNYDYSMWAFCGQQSSASYEYTQLYLDTMLGFEAEYPNMRFILQTGHTDGSGVDGNLHQRNEQVRDFAVLHGMILYDFADIESWDPDGNYFLPLGCNDYGSYDGGNWCAEWCAANPGSDLCVSCSCAHSQSLICNLKGRAFWWMMARLAGWPGKTEATCRGDCNCDGQITFADIMYFVSAMNGEQVWIEYHLTQTGVAPTCPYDNCNADANGGVTFADINPFANLIGQPCP